jgi:hypothetical protein
MTLLASHLLAAEPVLRGNRGAVYSVSSLGVDGSTFGPEFNPDDHFNGDRYKALDFRNQYPMCTRHDGKIYDFQGRMIRSGPYQVTQPLIGSSMPTDYVPLDQRRPSHPYRLSRLIVRSFSNLVFGEGRFPNFASDDQDTKDFAEALKAASEAAVRFLQLRNLGGSVGTAGVSWRFWQGKPRIRVHNGKHLIAHSWIDRDDFEVEHVTEIQKVSRLEWDPKEKKNVRRYFWQRRDWTPNADVTFVEARADEDSIEWIVDEEATHVHDDGYPHIVWVRNGADDDEATNEDGQCDFEGEFESLDGVDLLSSVLASGTTRNLDPTLVLKMALAEQQKAAATGVRKGSGNALDVGVTGDAKYLEIAGTATTAGITLLKEERGMILESVQCVVPSTAELTTAGTSAIAQKMLFAPMLSATNVHRTQYGGALLRLFEQMIASARKHYPEKGEDGELSYAVVVEHEEPENEDEEPREVETPVDFYLDLPPKIVSEPILDETGKPTGEKTTAMKELHPGKGKLRLEWPPYFEPTAADLQTKATAISAAAGAKPVLSQQTGVEMIAAELRVDPSTEWQRVTSEARTAAELEGGMFNGGTGGRVDNRDELPPAAKPRPAPAPKPPPGATPGTPSPNPAAE